MDKHITPSHKTAMLDGYTAVETSYCYTEQQGCTSQTLFGVKNQGKESSYWMNPFMWCSRRGKIYQQLDRLPVALRGYLGALEKGTFWGAEMFSPQSGRGSWGWIKNWAVLRFKIWASFVRARVCVNTLREEKKKEAVVVHNKEDGLAG